MVVPLIFLELKVYYIYINLCEAFSLSLKLISCHVTHEQVSNIPYVVVQTKL
jgi:hypothetical protein